VDRNKFCRGKGLELLIEAALAMDGASPYPDNGPDTGAVHLGPCEKTREVEHAFRPASGVVVWFHHYYSAVSLLVKTILVRGRISLSRITWIIPGYGSSRGTCIQAYLEDTI
jgi:hypothetical protein